MRSSPFGQKSPFTDTTTATATATAITKMEQQFINRLNAATISINAAIYTLNRISIRDALNAADNRGITVGVVRAGVVGPTIQGYFIDLSTLILTETPQLTRFIGLLIPQAE